jgi:hypothetical protein
LRFLSFNLSHRSQSLGFRCCQFRVLCRSQQQDRGLPLVILHVSTPPDLLKKSRSNPVPIESKSLGEYRYLIRSVLLLVPLIEHILESNASTAFQSRSIQLVKKSEKHHAPGQTNCSLCLLPRVHCTRSRSDSLRLLSVRTRACPVVTPLSRATAAAFGRIASCRRIAVFCPVLVRVCCPYFAEFWCRGTVW